MHEKWRTESEIGNDTSFKRFGELIKFLLLLFYHYFYQVLFYKKGNVYSICGLQCQAIKYTCVNYSRSFFPKLCDIRRKCCKTCYLHFWVLTSVGFGGNESQPIIRTVRPCWEFQRTTANAVADSLWLFSLLENKWSESYLNMTQIFAWIRRIGKEVWLKYADLNLKILQFHSDILEPARIRTNNAG